MRLNKNLIKGSSILLLGFGLFNFMHFLFQFFMARMLNISEYGILAVLFSIIYITLILTESIQTIIAKYSSNESDSGKLKNITKKSYNKCFKISLYLFIFYLLIAIPLSFILRISYLLLSINGLVIFLAFFLPISRGLMQGKKRFKSLSINMIVESGSKLIFGVLFVYLGFKVYGAIAGVLAGGIIAFFFTFFQLKDIFQSKEKTAQTPGIYDYAKPAFLINSIIIIFYSLDVILARIFFAPEIAGSYAIASILGKIIFWGTLPISKAMFPMSAENLSDKKKAENIFRNALSILIVFIMTALIIFYLFPDLIIKIFSGKNIPQAAFILFFSGIAFSFISLTNLALLYKLSRNKIKNHAYLFIFIIIEIILLSVFSSNLFQFSIAFITSSAIFLWGSLYLMND
ncbi:MAG: oligosaccharide flippase family protein [Nanoarchaeota archaeon]